MAATIPIGSGPSAVAADADRVWVSDEPGEIVAQIDPGQNRVVRTAELGNRPEGLVIAGDSVYVAVRAGGRAHRGGTLTLLTATAFDFLDPARAYQVQSWQTLILTNDGLTGFKRVGGGEGGRLVPDLATALPSPADGGRTYTFELRRGIRYSTGALVRPEDFRCALERSFRLSPAGGPPVALYFANLIGGSACEKPRACDLSRGIVTDADANTVTFRLTSPDPELPAKLALPVAFAVPAGAGVPVPATGPYRIATYDPKRGARLVRNPYFREWSSAAQPSGLPDSIVWRFGSSPANAVEAVEAGRADIAGDGVPADLLEVTETRFASQLHVSASAQTFFVYLNTRRPPFDDVRVRRAVNYAIDREALVRAGGGPEEVQPTCQVLPPNFPGYAPYCPYSLHPRSSGSWTAPDVMKARKLVAASGTKGQTIAFWWTRDFTGAPFEPVVAATFRLLGYRVHERAVRRAADYFSRIGDSRNRVQAAGGGWIADYASAYAFIATQLSCKSFQPASRANANVAEFCDRAIDREMKRAYALGRSDPEQAARAWERVDRDIVDRAPWLFLATPRVIGFVSPRVGNYQYSPQWGLLIDQLWVR